MNKIFVTKAFLPPKEEYEAYINTIWANNILTNQGPLLMEFESKVKAYLGVDNFQFVANGTMALQLALRALDIEEGEVITTPFSYVATTSAILWEKLTPVYVDIDEHTLNIDPSKIEAAITPKTKAILAVHVFGNPCDIYSIDKIAKKHNLKVIYDAAHAFGVQYKGKSIFSYGDISVCSFHATKVFHTIEGGGIFVHDKDISDKVELIKRFGHNGDDHIRLGINGKASEFQAAMGLCNIKYFKEIKHNRQIISESYDSLIYGSLQRQKQSTAKSARNYGYYPIIFENERDNLANIKALNEYNIYPRRYFYPSLNELPYLKYANYCPISESIAKRIACLPIYKDLDLVSVKRIATIINDLNER